MKRLVKWSCIVGGVLLTISFIVLILDYCNVFSCFGVQSNKLNSSFWSNYSALLGGIIGGALTLIGVVATIDENRKEQREEAIRLVMPMLKLFPADYDYKWQYIQFDANLTEESHLRPRKDIEDTAHVSFEIHNIGSRELHELYISNISSTFFEDGSYHHSLFPIIYSGDGYGLNLSFYEKGVYDNDKETEKFDTLISPIHFDCIFKDCLGNWYCQKFSISLMHNIKKNTPADKRALNISIERMGVQSAPKIVTEEELPWANDTTNRIMNHY